MTDHSTKLEDYLTEKISFALISQLAIARDLSPQDVFTPDGRRTEHLHAIACELDSLGIDPGNIARYVLLSQAEIFCLAENNNTLVTHLTDLLWTILGDPKNGGSPPEIYRHAAQAMVLTLIGVLYPSFSRQ